MLPAGTRFPTASLATRSDTFVFQDDKKFYQLELVNRETGFNKVFNSSANVGVINPLIKVSGLQSRRWGKGGSCRSETQKNLRPRMRLRGYDLG